MKNQFLFLKQSILVALFSSIIVVQSFSQFNLTNDHAKTLNKGENKIAGQYTGSSFLLEGESFKFLDVIGARYTIGLMQSFDLSLNYSRLILSGELGNNRSSNYFELSPKISLYKDNISLCLPIGLFLEKGHQTFVLKPSLIFTYPVSNKFELNLSPKTEIFLESDPEAFIEITFGAGFSSDLNRWSVRPEIGFVFNPGDEGTIFLYGLGIDYSF